MIPQDILDVLRAHVVQGEHVFLVCRTESVPDVLDSLPENLGRLIDPVKVLYQHVDSQGGELLFDNSTCLFVRHNISDELLTIMGKQSPSLHIYIL